MASSLVATTLASLLDGYTGGFRFIIRQVGKIFHLIDLEGCKGYEWAPGPFSMSTIFDQMKDTLYLYEPAEEKTQPSMLLHELPSLATLSPFSPKIAEYNKARMYEELYVWPWSLSELQTVAEDSKLGLSTEELLKRYSEFGGMVRHVLTGNNNQARFELEKRVANLSLKVLQSKAINIDRDEQGYNLSGYVPCYNKASGMSVQRTRPRLHQCRCGSQSRADS